MTKINILPIASGPPTMGQRARIACRCGNAFDVVVGESLQCPACGNHGDFWGCMVALCLKQARTRHLHSDNKWEYRCGKHPMDGILRAEVLAQS